MGQYIVSSPFERVAVDIVRPLPTTTQGNRYMLVIMDYFSKWPEVHAIPNQEATTVAQAMVECWVSRYGVPPRITLRPRAQFRIGRV